MVDDLRAALVRVAADADAKRGSVAQRRRDDELHTTARLTGDRYVGDAVSRGRNRGVAAEEIVKRLRAENPGRSISVRTVNRWRSELRAGGMEALKDGRRERNRVFDLDDPTLKYFRDVYLRIDESSLASVLVFSCPDDRLICKARSNARLPANATGEHLQQAIAGKKRARKAAREYFGDARLKLARDLSEETIRAAQADARARKSQQTEPPPAAPNLKPIHSHLDAAAAELSREVDRVPSMSIFNYVSPHESEADEGETVFDTLKAAMNRRRAEETSAADEVPSLSTVYGKVGRAG